MYLFCTCQGGKMFLAAEKQKKTLRGKRLFCWFVNCIIKKGGENFSEFHLISVCMILPVCELKMFEL
jgi:hypothetical protein